MSDNKVMLNAIPILDYSGAFIQRRKLTEDDWKTILSQEGEFQLDLAYTHVTDDELKQLEEKKNLRLLCLIECGLVTSEAVKSLQAKLPDCKIEVSPKNHDHSFLRIVSTIIFICGLAGALAWSVREKPEVVQGDPNTSTQFYYPPEEGDTSLKKLATMPDLETLLLKEGCKIDESGYRAIASLKHLKTLILFNVKTTAQDLKILAQSKTLQNLYLNGERLLDGGLVTLASFALLKELHIIKTEHITDTGLGALKNVLSLELLSISGGNRISDEGLKAIAACKNIRSLTLESCPKITDEGMKYLASMEKLSHIGLERTQVAEEGFTNLLKCPKLTSVALGSEIINDDVLGIVGKLPRLTNFAMTNCFEVSDRGLLCITSHPELQSLWLGACLKLSSQGLAPLKKHNNLVTLQIECCAGMTDEVFDVLPKSLTSCVLGKTDEDHFTYGGIRRFSRSHPDCKVTRIQTFYKPL